MASFLFAVCAALAVAMVNAAAYGPGVYFCIATYINFSKNTNQ
jgi:hypothetical protein